MYIVYDRQQKIYVFVAFLAVLLTKDSLRNMLSVV